VRESVGIGVRLRWEMEIEEKKCVERDGVRIESVSVA
jgi:hypothetical protein